MLHDIRLFDDIDRGMVQSLWGNLAGITDRELHWRPHPDANSIQWIMGHVVWCEDWFRDVILQTGRYHTDLHAKSYPLVSIDEIREYFERSRDAYRSALEGLTEQDLEQRISYMGESATIRHVVITHTTHLAGSRYQIRYIRGTYSRAYGTDKKAFDRF